MELIEKLKKSRESQVEAGLFNFTVRRPTDMEVANMGGEIIREGDIMRRFVVGWDVKELDIIPGGTGVAIPFETELFIEWVADKPNLWEPLTKAITTAYETHRASVDDALGKPHAG